MNDDLLADVQTLCKRHSIPVGRARRAVQILLNITLLPRNENLPPEPEKLWSKRDGEDLKLNPLEFFEKYWGKYIAFLTQCDLRKQDLSLFEAIKGHCKSKGYNPTDYLPLPASPRASRKKLTGQRPEGAPQAEAHR